MTTSFAVLLFRPEEVADRALSQGFAVALGGYDVPAPHLLVAPLRGFPGWSAAFYRSGAKLPRASTDDELDHACELFEDELSPAVCVLDAAAEHGAEAARVYALTYSEEVVHDDAYRLGPDDFERRFVREGDDGIETGFEVGEHGEAKPVRPRFPDGATPDEEYAAVEAAIGPHRGTSFLARELGAPGLGALVGALFAPERRVDIRLVEPSQDAIEGEVRRLNRTLRRVDGRGAFHPPAAVAGVPTPPVYHAFVRGYDWADPADPGDLYRELSIGAVVGTLRFFREDDLRALDKGDAWTPFASRSLFPVAELRGSALSGARDNDATIALAPDREHLELVRRDGSVALAGPTFGELLRYLALGWKTRTEEEEDILGALMLRAQIRTTH